VSSLFIITDIIARSSATRERVVAAAVNMKGAGALVLDTALPYRYCAAGVSACQFSSVVSI
jgi:hypothetical protein